MANISPIPSREPTAIAVHENGASSGSISVLQHSETVGVAPIEGTAPVVIKVMPGKTGIHTLTPVTPESSAEYDVYAGKYTVEPKAATATTLATAHKVLTKDVTVVKIPKYVVSNLAGGDTVYIGGDADYGQV